jgi:hypothetical protein
MVAVQQRGMAKVKKSGTVSTEPSEDRVVHEQMASYITPRSARKQPTLTDEQLDERSRSVKAWTRFVALFLTFLACSSCIALCAKRRSP